ncbi:MAG: dimethylarginine dimethylaminohydrolase [Alphaproteobacteria bacterium]|nr:dimethylarginine dimethylaminohydrolase [Alphaproteobacteria bacterium]
MRAHEFTHAIVRRPGKSVVDGIRKGPEAPTYEAVAAEHERYVAALRDAGLALDVLPPLEEFPDSVFVEDPALVMPEGAILLRPGVASRLGEAEHMRGALQKHFSRLLELEGDRYADGGDVMITPDAVVIGLSKRTNRAGAERLVELLGQLGRKARIAETPADVLHLKSASSLLDENTVMATRQMADSAAFPGLEILVVPEGEEGAANFLRINDTVFVGEQYPRTCAMLLERGYNVQGLPTREIAKLDAGLSCMSLRW